MGQCVSSSRSVLPQYCAPVPLESAVDLPAPSFNYLSTSIPLLSDLPLPVPTTSPVLSPDVLRQVYQRALYLCHCPLSTLSWKCVTYSTGIHWHSQLTCGVTEATKVQPADSVRIQPSDHLIRPSPEWFPALLDLCSTLRIAVHCPSTPTPAVIPDQHYPDHYKACSPSLPALLCFVPHLIAALSIYPPAFFHRLELRELWLCDSLTCSGATAWMASFLSKRLYVDCSLIDSVHVKSLVHHELLHFIDAIHHSPSSPPLPHPISRFCAVPDPAWAALNDPSFRYGDGGLHACGDTESAYTGRVRGRAERGSFPSRYAQSGMEEDRAEVWAALVRDRHSITHARDARLRQKGVELERRVKEWSGGLLDGQWWERTQKAGGGANFSHTRHERTV